MLKEERLKQIMREINLHNKVLSVDLSKLLNVSEDTVRRDLKELVDEGRVLKVHGGAVSKSLIAQFSSTEGVYKEAEKKAIAAKAVKEIKDDMVLLFEGGTTMLELARLIPNTLRLTIFTISPHVAVVLANKKNIEVITIGGRLKKNYNIHTGSFAINTINDIKPDITFMGVNALSAEKGLTDIDWEIVQVNKAMVHHSNRTVLLTISDKLNLDKKFRVCKIEEIHTLITELKPDAKILQPYKAKGIRVL